MAKAEYSIETVSIIGAGAWGTTLARHLTVKGLQVQLWAYEPEVAAAISSKGENSTFLPGIPLPGSIVPTADFEHALHQTNLIVFAVPSHAARSVLHKMSPLLRYTVPFVSATKGIEEETLMMMTQIVQDALPSYRTDDLAVLSGPSFAVEVCKGRPTALVLAGVDAKLVQRLQSLFMTPQFRIYAGSDVIGVQLGGALKNVMAVAAGIVDGLELGHNARAALITRGLAEIIRLGTAMGAQTQTFYGLSGVGDLVLTCTGPLSRNYSVGMRLAQGERLADILQGVQAVAEGVRTARAALRLAQRWRVEMPIVREVCAVLFDGKPPRQAVSDLMERAATEEIRTAACDHGP